VNQNIEINFSKLSPNEFEGLCYDVMHSEGFLNMNWRDGGSDGGRDIEAFSLDVDKSGYTSRSKWFCDAKLYKGGVSFSVIHGSLTRAAANNPDFLLFIVIPHLTPQCKNEIQLFEENHRTKFKVRVWEKKDLTEKLIRHPELLRSYFPESWSEVVEMRLYFKESIDVLNSFRNRVKAVWQTPEKKPYSDSIIIKPKDPSVKFSRIIDFSTKVNEEEAEFLTALLSAAKHMQHLLADSFGWPGESVLIQIAEWSECPNEHVVIPLRLSEILNNDRRARIGGLLALLLERFTSYEENGIVALSGDAAPFDGVIREHLYVIRKKIEAEQQ
jgi:hypothetical protein